MSDHVPCRKCGQSGGLTRAVRKPPDVWCEACGADIPEPDKRDRTEAHGRKFRALAARVGIGWPDSESLFMGRDIEYWTEKYLEDEHLNNHPLCTFDFHYGYHRAAASRVGVKFWSMSCTVCCLKRVIIDRVKKHLDN